MRRRGALSVGELRTIVDDHDLEADPGGDRSERRRHVAGAASTATEGGATGSTRAWLPLASVAEPWIWEVADERRS